MAVENSSFQRFGWFAESISSPARHVKWFYIIAGAALTMSLLISGYVSSIDVKDNPGISSTEIWISEATSHFIIFLLLPVFPIALREISLQRSRWALTLGCLGLGVTTFWLLHVAGMLSLRNLLFPLVLDRPYGVNLFASDQLIYEFSKDIFTFGLLAVGFVTIKGTLARRAEAANTPLDRIALRSGATAHYVNPDDIITATAAANYIEVRLSDRTILARMSLRKLAGIAAEKNASLVQVHRSHLVNKDKIKTVIPRGDGGVHIEMSDGSKVPGSRSFRHDLVEHMNEAAIA